MPGFSVIYSPHEPIWMPVNSNSTIYIGQIVQYQGSSTGVSALGSASGASDTTGKKIPFGVVVGLNDEIPTYNSTYGQYSIGVNTQAEQSARYCYGQEGMWNKGDKQVFAQIIRLTPSVILSGNIYAGTIGTPLTEVAANAGNATGVALTCSPNIQCTPVAYNNLVYCRKGTNMGIYRVATTVNSNNSVGFSRAFPYPISSNDVFVVSNVGLGVQRIQLDSTSTFIDGNAALTSDYYFANVYSVFLDKKYDEHVVFSFNADSFCATRA